MVDGIFSDDLPDVEESPANDAGQGSVEQAAGPAEAGQPAEAEAEASATQPQEQAQPKALTPEEIEEQQKLENLRRKYGDNPDQMLRGLRELEKRLGQMGTEKEQLRQQFAMLQGYLQALPQILGQQAQTQAQPQAAQPEEDEKVLKDIEELYPGFNRALAKRYERTVAQALQNLQAQMVQQIQPLQQFVQQMQLMEFYRQQVASAREKYADFDDLRADIQAIYQEQPTLGGLPNGMEIAYQLAKARRAISTQAATQAAVQKTAARLPGTAGARAEKPQTPEKQFLNAIFGQENEDEGIFKD